MPENSLLSVSLALFLCGAVAAAEQAPDAASAQQPQAERLTENEPAAGWSHMVGPFGATYYLIGPQQAHPPEGSFPAGTRVRILSEHGSYIRVESADGITAYVDAGAVDPLAP